MKAKWRRPPAWKGVLRFLAYAVAAAGLILAIPLAKVLLGRTLAVILFVLLEATLLLWVVIRPRSAKEDSDWRHLEDRRRARVWQAIRRLRFRNAAAARKQHASDRRP